MKHYSIVFGKCFCCVLIVLKGHKPKGFTQRLTRTIKIKQRRGAMPHVPPRHPRGKHCCQAAAVTWTTASISNSSLTPWTANCIQTPKHGEFSHPSHVRLIQARLICQRLKLRKYFYLLASSLIIIINQLRRRVLWLWILTHYETWIIFYQIGRILILNGRKRRILYVY